MMLKFSGSKYGILENEGFEYTKDIRQLESSLNAKESNWIWKLETLAPQGLNVADKFIVKIVVVEGKVLDLSLLFD